MKKFLFAVPALCVWSQVFAQVAVRNEPRHHNVFESDYVRILDVYIAPNDTTQFHVHATPSVFITFTKTATGSQLIGQQPSKSVSTAGGVWYDSLVTPRVHRVWNEDTAWFHVMDIELIAGKARPAEPVFQTLSMQLLFDERLVRGYHVQLAAKEDLQLPSTKNGCVLIFTGDADVSLQSGNNIQHRLMKPGHYCWIDAGKECRINSNTEQATFIILQLK